MCIMNQHSYFFADNFLAPSSSHFIHFTHLLSCSILLISIMLSKYEGGRITQYLEEIALRTHWIGFHSSFMLQIWECFANFHSRSAQSSSAQVFLELGFIRKSQSLIAYVPCKAKNVSIIFQGPVENTCAFLAQARCYRFDDLKNNVYNIM